LIRSVLFDLDDTLYSEITFVQSGFRAVGCALHQRCGTDVHEWCEACMQVLEEHGRGQIFNIVLQRYGIEDHILAAELATCYREHVPQIRLADDVVSTLEILRSAGVTVGLITDGLAGVQRLKVRALKLESLLDVIVYTDDLGREFWKPHVLPFQTAMRCVHVESSEAVYVGNDDRKDFKGPNELGMTTVKIGNEQWSPQVPAEYQAKYAVSRISELIKLLQIGVNGRNAMSGDTASLTE
jgi:putative hydrolase of the HAD superfamily